MSEFYDIIQARPNENLKGKPLWKYNLNDLEFNKLRKSLIETKSLLNVDPRDCTIYYAEWWKKSYVSGSPSKKDVFSSIENLQNFNEEHFFNYAKRGAQLLGIKWIQNQNTLYFRTLLLQGGLPITHITNHSGAYKNFLLRILELSPNTIDDFAFDFNITSLLPISCRNDTIYESCLEIVKAIINEDENFLLILNENQELQEIRNELRVKKQSLQIIRRKSNFRSAWIIKQQSDQIRLYLGFPETIDPETFKSLLIEDEDNKLLDFEYRLFVNENLLCKFKKKSNDSFRTIWINQGDLIWDCNEKLPDIYLVDASGSKTECKNLVSYYPRLDRPSLWTKYSENEWVLEKGTHTSQMEGFILSPTEFSNSNAISTSELKICCKNFNWMEFKNSIEFSHHSDKYVFKTESKKIEWYIWENKPDWIKQANYPIVRRKPKVSVYNQEGNIIPNPRLQWRPKNSPLWNEWNSGTMPPGLIQLKISVGEIFEFEEFFNIERFDLKTSSATLHQVELEITYNQFTFQINEDGYVGITKESADKFLAYLKNNEKIPKSIQASLRYGNQTSGLRFEMSPPFNGIEILDNEGNVVPNGECFIISKLYGYRLLSNSNNLIANIYNKNRSNIIISQSLSDNFMPLRKFEDKIIQLAGLSDEMDNDVVIVMEICEESNGNQSRLRDYKFKKYTNTVSWSFDGDERVNIITDAIEQPDLYAVPIDCDLQDLDLHDLNNRGGHYHFREDLPLEKFIVFSDRDSMVKIHPVLISQVLTKTEITQGGRIQEILEYKNQLLESQFTDDVWQKLLRYYDICAQNDLPYSTFNILRSLSLSSEVAAKAFLFLASFDESQAFSEVNYKYMENDIGFAFHWVCKNDWNKAMEWIGCFNNGELLQCISAAVRFLYEDIFTNDNSIQILNFIIQDDALILNENFHLNRKVNEMRSSLGARVLSELPSQSPKIPEKYKSILPVNSDNANVKILLKAPLSIALSIYGKDDEVWRPNNENIRRNIKYCQQLNPEWYSQAINYCLNKLNN
jgi:hypothetical protein